MALLFTVMRAGSMRACVELAEARPDASACKDTSKQEQLLHRFCEGPVSLEACTRLPTASTVLAQTLLSKLGANAKSLLPLGGRSPTRTRPCSCCRACGARTRSPRSASRLPREREAARPLNHCLLSHSSNAEQRADGVDCVGQDAVNAPWIEYFSNRLLLPVHPFNKRPVHVGPPLVQQLHRVSDLRHPR